MGCPPPYKPTLLSSLREAVPRFRAAFDGLDESELIAHPIPGKWSMLEFAEHVALVDLGWTGLFIQAVAKRHPELGTVHPRAGSMAPR
ncbi:MAG TPA: DinB family protein [Planctomycetota bacterium]|nr:DinB family protein [Planctomycetota bacterium]